MQKKKVFFFSSLSPSSLFSFIQMTSVFRHIGTEPVACVCVYGEAGRRAESCAKKLSFLFRES